jgi:hypothetical protein
MQVFNFLWQDSEEQDNHLFYHPDKTEEQFQEDCKKALVEVGDIYIDNEESWITLFDWVNIAAIKLEEYGYTRITPILFSLWGNYIIEEDRDEVDKLEEAVGNRLLQKAISRNTEIEKKAFKEAGLDG